MIALLDFLQRNELKATLFTIAADLEDQRKCGLLQEAVPKGTRLHLIALPTLLFTI